VGHIPGEFNMGRIADFDRAIPLSNGAMSEALMKIPSTNVIGDVLFKT
jgi:hypothetical protein